MASTRRLAAILAAFFIPTVLVLPLLVTHGLIFCQFKRGIWS